MKKTWSWIYLTLGTAALLNWLLIIGLWEIFDADAPVIMTLLWTTTCLLTYIYIPLIHPILCLCLALKRLLYHQPVKRVLIHGLWSLILFAGFWFLISIGHGLHV